LLLQVISLWINALLSDVIIIIIKLAQMTRAATQGWSVVRFDLWLGRKPGMTYVWMNEWGLQTWA